MQALGERIKHIEKNIENYSISFKTMVDALNEQKEDITWIKDKIIDLEARSRRNNLKIRGIPESVASPQLAQYVHTLVSSLLPSLLAHELIVDRVHRILKPSFLPAEIPRDVLHRVNFYHVKDQLLTAFRQADIVPNHYALFQLLPDLSRHTLQS